MATSTRTPTATDRLRELLDLIDATGTVDAAHQLVTDDDLRWDIRGFEAHYLLGVLKQSARYALHEWEGQA